MTQQISNIIAYAVENCEDHRDPRDGELNLTAVEEDTIDHFDLDLEWFDDEDVSFLIFKALQRRKLL